MPKRYHCPVELAVDVIGGKWRPVILAHLKEGVHRYGELRRRMPAMSEKMLTQRLRELEADGLVARDDHATTPPHVEYRLTNEGLSLAPVLQALYDWGAERAVRTGTAIEEQTLLARGDRNEQPAITQGHEANARSDDVCSGPDRIPIA